MNFFKFIFKWSFFLVVWLGVFATITLFYYLHDLPSLEDLEAESGTQIVDINYSNGNKITSRGEIYTSEVNYYELPQNLINAVIATEDRRFFSHHGVDIVGIVRAFYVNRQAHRIVQGGSTITQQLAKLLFLDSNKTFKRKIQEVLLAVQLERHFTKEQIFVFYLNRAYFGSGNYGIANAAKDYFGKEVAKLTLNESAILGGLLKAPSKFSPKVNRKNAEERADIVLKNMIDAGLLNEKNFSEINQNINYKSDGAQRLYFTDFVAEQLGGFLNAKTKKEKILKVTSTLNEKFQEKLETKLEKFIAKNNKKLSKSQIAVVVMRKDGAILALSGGNNYQKSQFNRAIYAKRQPGSAFKTFVYLAAFESGFTPQDIFEDKKINIGTWLPDNYENKYLGEVNLKTAFTHSLNSVAIQLARKVGGESIAKLSHKCGIISKINKSDPTIALGTNEMSLYELTSAYATIANDGKPVIPYSILEIKNNAKEELYSRQSSGFDPVISQDSVRNIKEILREVVASGTGKNANVASDIHGKTGTSQDFRDAWFVGFNNEYVIGVWIGNDDNSPTNKITGGSLPAALFAELI